jgi:hypothetical protein
VLASIAPHPANDRLNDAAIRNLVFDIVILLKWLLI